MHDGLLRAAALFLAWLLLIKFFVFVLVLSLGTGLPDWLQLPAILVLVLVVGRKLRFGSVEVGVCAACDARWRGVLRARRLATLMVVPFTILPIVALDIEQHGRLPRGTAGWLSLALAVAWIAALVGVRVGRLRDLLVTAKAIHDQVIILRGVHPDARSALVAETAAADAVRRIPPA
jgi:hypothetical protein